VTHVVGCLKITDLRHNPKVPSRLGYCSKCTFPIHIALSTPVFDDMVYMCMSCIPWDEVEDISPLTLEQVADIRRVLKEERENGNNGN
jgi:hypothetical protein